MKMKKNKNNFLVFSLLDEFYNRILLFNFLPQNLIYRQGIWCLSATPSFLQFFFSKTSLIVLGPGHLIKYGLPELPIENR